MEKGERLALLSSPIAAICAWDSKRGWLALVSRGYGQVLVNMLRWKS